MSLTRKRFRGLLPVVIDVETSGVDVNVHAMLEIAAQVVAVNEDGFCEPQEIFHQHVLPFDGAEFDQDALQITQIKPTHPLRFALDEKEALLKLHEFLQAQCLKHDCRRAVIVGHNVSFDHTFISRGFKRWQIPIEWFHAFIMFDTTTLAATALGETSLARIMMKTGIPFDAEQVHSALYDTEKTAQLYCLLCNHMRTKPSHLKPYPNRHKA